MLSRTPSSLLVFHRFPTRLFVRTLIGISALWTFKVLYDAYGYMPWPRGITKALGMTLEVHLGLWLATLEIQSRWRFLVAALLIPSMVGVYFLLWHRNLFTIIAAALALIWLLSKVLRGRRFEY